MGTWSPGKVEMGALARAWIRRWPGTQQVQQTKPLPGAGFEGGFEQTGDGDDKGHDIFYFDPTIHFFSVSSPSFTPFLLQPIILKRRRVNECES